MLRVPIVVRQLAFAAAMVLVTVMMLMPSPGTTTSNDKVDHVLVFAVLALLGAWAEVPYRWLVPGLAAYAVFTELLQAVGTEVRHGDVLDVAADLVGIGAGLLVAAAIARWRRARYQRDRLRTARPASSDPVPPRG